MTDLSPRERVLRDLAIETMQDFLLYADRANPDVGMGLSSPVALKRATFTIDTLIEQRINDLSTLARAAAEDLP